MRIVIIGAPGSGKTWLAKYVEIELNLYHIEGDSIFWNNGKEVLPEKFRLEVLQDLQKKRWIYEGHVSKVIDLLQKQDPIVIVIKDRPLTDLFRSFRKDLLNLVYKDQRSKSILRMKHHLTQWHKMKEKRDSIVKNYSQKHPERIIYWSGQTSTLEDLVKRLKSI